MPTVIVPDNLKAAVVRAAFVDERAALHRSYRELARHYGCRIDPAPPRSPEKKGRVEAGVGYLRRNFLPTLQSRDVGDAAAASTGIATSSSPGGPARRRGAGTAA